MKALQDKVAVITGGASGIGRATADALAARGCRLVLADVEPDALDKAATELQGQGADVLPVQTDVSRLDAVQALADAAYGRFGAVHVLFNNAGISIGGPLHAARHADWQWAIGVNLWGVIHGVECFAGRMVDGGEPGHIVNTASMAGLIASRDLGIYNTTKAAVVSLSETLAKDLRDTAVRVSVLCPMGVQTRIRESERNRPAELGEKYSQRRQPDLLGRWIDPAEVGALVVQAIEEERLYILTHFEGREHWERRAARISSAFPEAPPEG